MMDTSLIMFTPSLANKDAQKKLEQGNNPGYMIAKEEHPCEPVVVFYETTMGKIDLSKPVIRLDKKTLCILLTWISVEEKESACES